MNESNNRQQQQKSFEIFKCKLIASEFYFCIAKGNIIKTNALMHFMDFKFSHTTNYFSNEAIYHTIYSNLIVFSIYYILFEFCC